MDPLIPVVSACMCGQKLSHIKGAIIIIIILAVHATAGRWPPQLAPCTSILGRSHPLTANGFLDVISPSPFWVFLLVVFHLWSVHSDVIFAHLVFFILATCPAHCPFMHFTFSIISYHPCFRSYYLVPDLVSPCDVQ